MQQYNSYYTNVAVKNVADVYLIDFMYFIRTIPPVLPATFGELARVILKHACSVARTVHIIWDTYSNEPSIKDNEHTLRGEHDTDYTIQGRHQRRPSDFNRALQSKSFKTALIQFLNKQVSEQEHQDILCGKTVFFAAEQACVQIQVRDSKVVKIPVEELSCQHHEADTQIILHARFVAENNKGSVIAVRSSDTDVSLFYCTLPIN